jgi:hypothetical protein
MEAGDVTLMRAAAIALLRGTAHLMRQNPFWALAITSLVFRSQRESVSRLPVTAQSSAGQRSDGFQLVQCRKLSHERSSSSSRSLRAASTTVRIAPNLLSTKTRQCSPDLANTKRNSVVYLLEG